MTPLTPLLLLAISQLLPPPPIPPGAPQLIMNVRVRATRTGTEVLRATLGHKTPLAIWYVTACNLSPVIITRSDIALHHGLQNKGLSLIPASLVPVTTSRSIRTSPAARGATAAAAVGIAVSVMMASGRIAASDTVKTGVLVGTELVSRLGAYLRGITPDRDTINRNLLQDTVVLNGLGDCKGGLALGPYDRKVAQLPSPVEVDIP